MKCRLIIFTFALLLLGCAKEQAAPEKQEIFASNYPLFYFAERIAGREDVVFFPKFEGDPAFWKPTPEQIGKMQQSSAILLNGATYEKWLTSASLPGSRTIDTSKAFQPRYIHIDEGIAHAHGPGGNHSHSGTAFTTWLDFNQAAYQASAIKDALEKQGTRSQKILDRNFNELIEDLKKLDTEMRRLSKMRPGVPLIASHPVYQYLARRYKLNIRSVMWEPEAEPTDREWAHLSELLAEHPARWMIWEGKPNPDSVARLRKMGVESIVFDPCGNRPDKGDFISVMKQNLANAGAIFKTDKTNVGSVSVTAR